MANSGTVRGALLIAAYEGQLQGRCPHCGCLVAAHAGMAISCPQCARQIDVPRQPTHAIPAERPAIQVEGVDQRFVLAILACVTAAPLAIAFFWIAHGHLDRAEPSAAPAAGWLLAILLLTVGAVAVCRPFLDGRGRLYLYALLVAIPVAIVAATLGAVYNAGENVLFMVLFIFFLFAVFSLLGTLLTALVVFAIIFVVRMGKRNPAAEDPTQRAARRQRRFAATFVIGWGLALAHSLAGVYLLTTLPSQVENARAAHQETPALSFAVSVLVLLVLALSQLRTRRRR